ncbi:MAG: hypothetical protein CL927_20560 [Deltaproteobacteria bacterium]|nr:hypothetical protein [Deltaproteobacteria bacterium]HCH66162.1 hypothetical protein [Deltaproteobacteria bacterium]
MTRAPGRHFSWLFLGGLGTFVAMVKGGCAPIPAEKESVDNALVGELLADVGPQVVIPSLERFSAAVTTFADALATWESAHADDADTTDAQTAAQQQWTTMMMVWQELELMQIGPAGSSLDVAAGEDLRDEIYSWPSVSPCQVDEELVAQGWTDPQWFERSLVNRYGLDALEHLAHGTDANACPPESPINADGTWAALGPAAIESARIAYARTLTEHLSDNASALLTAWSPSGGDFSGALSSPASRTPYEDDQEALNAVFSGLFYLELTTKDRKLAQPLGYIECMETACPELAEHPISGASVVAIAANLRGFRLMFTGGEGFGADDLLDRLGHADLATEILLQTDTAIDIADSTVGTVQEGVIEDPQRIAALYDAIAAVTTILKTDLVTVLAVDVPPELAGDND